MADHRVTDLSHGHPGKATYDTEEQEWKFSQNFTEGLAIKQLLPFKEWISPSIQVAPRAEENASVVAQNQMRWISKNLPESFPATPLVTKLVKASCETPSETISEAGSLLAIGCAYDSGRISGIWRPQIIAMPCGAAGHILRLIKPRIETRGWGKQSGARLSMLNLESIDTGLWVGTGGTIHQLVFADSENEKDCWLGVRQATMITIFRPKYGQVHKPVPASEQSTIFPPSRLNANPVATLTGLRTGSRGHSDFTFNPWFSRQFAVVDTLGDWSVWELVRPHSRKGSELLVPKKTGGIYNGHVQDDSSKAIDHDHADGWYRILWACNLNTIVVCNRRYLAVFNIKGKTIAIGHANLFPAGNTDWILDIERSSSNINHLFVLTTTRIFWIEIIPAGERNAGQNDSGGARTRLSYLHFISPDDETMKLRLLKSEHVSVAITSAKNQVVNYYSFPEEQSRVRASSRGTFNMSLELESKEERVPLLQTVDFLPCALKRSVNQFSGPGPRYVDKRVEFFQVWAITSDLRLISTLSAITIDSGKQLRIVAPDKKLLLSSRLMGPKMIDDNFIAPDDDVHLKNTNSSNAYQRRISKIPISERNDVRFTLNWRRIFQRIFMEELQNTTQSDPAPGSFDAGADFPELLNLAFDRIKYGIDNDNLPNSTLYEILGSPKVGEDLQEATATLLEFLKSLEQDQSKETNQTLAIKDLTVGSGISFLGLPDSKHPNMLKIFDQLVDYWMASLPIDLPNPARHTKFKAITQLTVELCLSSIGITLQERPTTVPDAVTQEDDNAIEASKAIMDNRTIRDSPPAYFSSQLVVMQDEPGLPTPTTTASVYSQTTSASGMAEDPVIARLRRYAPTIKAKLESGTNLNASILSHWPSKPRADPVEYSYETARQAYATANVGDEGRRSSRKEKARRRRRTEEFVKAVEPAVSRRLSLFSGSQPEAVQKLFSSQAVDDVAMTQPDRGTFGSRPVQKGKKKPKKPRTAGFK